jgi:hypothetical protein
LALVQYNLAELYYDQGNQIVAEDLYKRAAETWNQVDPRNPINMLWYSGALTQLQEESDRLIALAHRDEPEQKIG